MDLALMKKLCRMPTPILKRYLVKFLQSKRYHLEVTNDYIIAEGKIPVCLVAHMDTVFKENKYFQNKQFFYDQEKKILWSPAGAGFDDRAGVYAIIQIINAGFRPSIIFTDKEEVGGIGAFNLISDFPACPFDKCGFLIELDRANRKDMVFYDCNNLDFIYFIESFGFKEEFGTFSDISHIAPQWDIAAVNLSIGYEDEHSFCERLHCNWCDETIEKVAKILNKCRKYKVHKFDFVPFVGAINNYNIFWSN